MKNKFLLFVLLTIFICPTKNFGQEGGFTTFKHKELGTLIVGKTRIQELTPNVIPSKTKIDTSEYGWIDYSILDESVIISSHVFDLNQIIRKIKIIPKDTLELNNGLVINFSTLEDVELVLDRKNYYSDKPRITKKDSQYFFDKDQQGIWVLTGISVQNPDKMINFNIDTSLIFNEFKFLEEKICHNKINNYRDINEIVHLLKDLKIVNEHFVYDSIYRSIDNGLFQFRSNIQKYHLRGTFNILHDSLGVVKYLAINYGDILIDKSSDPFNLIKYRETNRYYDVGFWCSISGSPPEIILDMIELVNDRRINDLSEWMTSYNLEKRLTGAIGVLFRTFQEKSNIPNSLKQRAFDIITTKERINGCVGCFFGNYDKERIVRIDNLFDQYTQYALHGFIKK